MKISLKSNNSIKLFLVKDLFTKIIRHDKIVIIFVETYFLGIEETVYEIVCELYVLKRVLPDSTIVQLESRNLFIQSGRTLSALLVH